MAYDSSILNSSTQNQGVNVLQGGSAQEEEEKKKKEAQAASQQQQPPVQSPGTSSTIQAGQASLGSSGTPRSGLSTNLSAYKEVNQPVAGKLAEETGKALTSDVSKIAESVQKSQQQYQKTLSDIDKQRSQARTQALQTLSSVQGNRVPTSQQISEFRSLVSTPDKFTGGLQQYRTPEADAKLKTLQRRAEAATTGTGRRELLREAFGNDAANVYTRGEQNLDNLLLQTTEAGRSGLANTISQKREEGQGAITSAQQAVAEQLRALREREDQDVLDIQNQLQGRISQEKQAQQKAMQDRFKSFEQATQQLVSDQTKRRQDIEALQELIRSGLAFGPQALVNNSVTGTDPTKRQLYSTKAKDLGYDYNVYDLPEEVKTRLGIDKLSRSDFSDLVERYTGIRPDIKYDIDPRRTELGQSSYNQADISPYKDIDLTPIQFEAIRDAYSARGGRGYTHDDKNIQDLINNQLEADRSVLGLGNLSLDAARVVASSPEFLERITAGMVDGTRDARLQGLALAKIDANQQQKILDALEAEQQKDMATEYLKKVGIDYTAGDAMDRQLLEQKGLDTRRFLSQQEIDRYNALMRLAGGQQLDVREPLLSPSQIQDARNIMETDRQAALNELRKQALRGIIV